jgi:tRNA (guanine-N7-)-methyltransferase
MRIRQHVNPNVTFFSTFHGERPALVADRPLEVEIGCADAQFLFERAVVDPGRQYVGLEIREDMVELVNKRAGKLAAPVVAVFCHAQKHLDEIFAPRTIDRVYINFPDPWFKRRHADRRMVDEELVCGLAPLVRAGGDVMIQSDVWEVALEAMDAFERHDDVFANLAGEWTFWRHGNPFGVRSWREQNAEETGLPIWRIRYVRR